MDRVSRRQFLQRLGTAALAAPAVNSLLASTLIAGQPAAASAPDNRPNILFCLSDDWGWPFSSVLGQPAAAMPVFQRVCNEGVRFDKAFCSSPSCTPSRGAILTGQNFYRLGEGANLASTLHPQFPCYPDLLEAAGYAVGYSEKGWSPGDVEAAGRTRNPAGPKFDSFDAFFKTAGGKPFCFWFGSKLGHRRFTKGAGLAAGKKLADVKVPACLPDSPDIRGDLLDYFMELEEFDRQVGALLAMLEQAGKLDNTLVVMTGDNGFPFPRGKCNLYDVGVREPLAVMWKARARGARVVDDFVCLTDLAPTFLQAAGVDVPPDVTGRSLMNILTGDKSGLGAESGREFVVVGRERHYGPARTANVGYPSRAIRTHDFLYIRNFQPDRWPAGDPEKYGDCDESPSKQYLLDHRDEIQVRPLVKRAFAKRPAEELYDLHADPDQLRNIAAQPQYAPFKQRLAKQLTDYLTQTNDPRATGQGEVFDLYPYRGPIKTIKAESTPAEK